MANQKYDNLTVMMTSGQLNWAGDSVVAILMQGVTFDAADVKVEDAGGTRMQVVPISQRSVAADGSLLGSAVSFNGMPKDTDFQMLIAKEFGPGLALGLIAFYDEDGDGQPLNLKNNGTLIVRPEQTLPAEDTGQGSWVTI
jgi:hypothetical protein